MVAAAKLRRAQAQAEASRPYAKRMGEMMAALAAADGDNPSAPALLVGNGREQTHLLVAVTADRGLAGAFNSNIARAVRNQAQSWKRQGKTVKILALGRKGNDCSPPRTGRPDHRHEEFRRQEVAGIHRCRSHRPGAGPDCSATGSSTSAPWCSTASTR